MNRNILLAFGAIAILVVLGGAVFVMNKNSSLKPVGSPDVANDNPASAQKSLKDLLTAGQSQKCTYSDKINDVDAQGTVYISSGKMRTDMSTQIGDKPFMSHMIVKDSKAYSWTDGQTMGFMMAFDPDEVAQGAPTGTPKSVDINKYIDYKCDGWSADETMFTPPSSVKFQEMGAMMSPSGTQTQGQGSQYNCSACNNLTGDSKAQCLTALKCN